MGVCRNWQHSVRCISRPALLRRVFTLYIDSAVQRNPIRPHADSYRVRNWQARTKSLGLVYTAARQHMLRLVKMICHAVEDQSTRFASLFLYYITTAPFSSSHMSMLPHIPDAPSLETSTPRTNEKETHSSLVSVGRQRKKYASRHFTKGTTALISTSRCYDFPRLLWPLVGTVRS